MRPAGRSSRRLAVALAVAGLCGALGAAGAATPRPRLVLVSWDGAADWVVDRLLAEGRLPNLAALAARGVRAEHSVTGFPSKTAVGHAALWTGAWGDVDGIAGNTLPVEPLARHTLLESRSGFSAEALAAEPLFVTAAKAGRRVVVLSATQTAPVSALAARLARDGVPADRLIVFNGFEHEIATGHMLEAGDLRPAAGGWGRVRRRRATAAREAELAVGDAVFHLLFYDDPANPVRGLDSVLVREGSRDPARATAETVLTPEEAPESGVGGWSPMFPVRRAGLVGNTSFRLFALSPDGSKVALYQRAVEAAEALASGEQTAAYLAAYPAFDDDPFPLYDRGGFGPPLMAGGDGTAERRALEVVAQDTTLLIAGTRFALAAWHPDLLFHYSPMTDGAGHSWVGALDPASPVYDPALAARLWPFYARVYEILDGWLGEIVRAAPPETIVALVSDHGMEGVGRQFFPDRALEQAGLLARRAGGEIDLAHTRALVPAFGSFIVRVNTTDCLGGIVPPAEREAVAEAAAQALLDAREPETGRHLVERVFLPGSFPGLGIGGPRGGDLYFDTAPGYLPSKQAADHLTAPWPRPWGAGEHGFWPERRSMHAIVYLAGPGVRAGVEVPPIRHVDVAPTLARLLGIPAPPQAVGHVIGEILEAPDQPAAPAEER